MLRRDLKRRLRLRSRLRSAGIAGVALLLASGLAAARTQLDAETLASGKYPRPVDFSAYAPGADATAPSNRFEGRLLLSGKPSTRTLVRNDDFLDEGDASAARTWPQDFDFAFVQDGEWLIPVARGPQPGSHPWWEFSVEPGRVWDEPGDGGKTRASVPFALVQRNANCTHNGVLTFLFDDAGNVSRAAVQVGSETCLYLQLDLWGLLDAQYLPGPVENAGAVVEAHRREVAARLPVKPIAALAGDRPGLVPGNLAIGDARARSTHGFVFDGVHYRGGCATRHGEYPWCDALLVPSYSLAKSVVAGLAAMRLERLYPGILDEPVSRHVPASGCRGEKWRGRTLRHLLDMTTGQYDSPTYMADEDDERIGLFFSADSHAGRLAFACEAYPEREAPGRRWVYHTSDTYLLGTALQHALRAIPGRERDDVFDDVLWADVFGPLGLSPTARRTRRSYDQARQPFFGWGLTLLPDDIAKLGAFLARGDGRIDGNQVLDPALLAAALQRDPGDRGLQAATLRDYRYQHGFWARNLQDALGCDAPQWVPFLSGFGGITVVPFANGATWYGVADDGLLPSILFERPALEAAKLGPLCR